MKGSAPERLVSGSDDFTMFLWEPAVSKQPKIRMTGHQQVYFFVNVFLPGISCIIHELWYSHSHPAPYQLLFCHVPCFWSFVNWMPQELFINITIWTWSFVLVLISNG